MDELERALDDCLQRLGSGKASLAQCLARYPEYAAELRPMLEAGLELKRGKQLRPSGAVRNRARAKLMAHIEAHPRQSRRIQIVPRLAFAFIAMVLALFLVGTGVAQAAMPGDPLYGLKLTSEQAWRAAAPDPVSVDLFLASRRADELVALAGKPATTPKENQASKAGTEAQVLAAYTDVLSRLAKETDKVHADKIMSELQSHQTELSEAGIHVTELDEIIVTHGQSQENHGQGQGNGNGNGNGGGNGNGNGNGNGGGNGNGNGNNP